MRVSSPSSLSPFFSYKLLCGCACQLRVVDFWQKIMRADKPTAPDHHAKKKARLRIFAVPRGTFICTRSC